jgi:hypothetical protein
MRSIRKSLSSEKMTLKISEKRNQIIIKIDKTVVIKQ